MSDIIQLLPDSVANQIAAGEVIQRPASIIKELVENALDAGATDIEVWVQDAGKSLVQVIDNGQGMSTTDARMAFERHATSKIRQATDLFHLQTMGFRGEALASIAAVAQVELRTKQKGEEVGTALRIEGSKVVSVEPASVPVGANFAVRNLFFNIPARRKFLKSHQTELSHIMAEMERIALSRPDVTFSLHSDDSLLLSLPEGNFRRRIAALFGQKTDSQLIPVEVDTNLVKISGFVGVPTAARRKGARQFLFANGRFMRHPYFAKAIQSAYDRLVAEGMQLPFFLSLQVDPGRLDVNIHPTKTEIKFEDDTAIFQILLAAVREALGKYGAVPAIDFAVEGRPYIPPMPQTDEALRQIQQPQIKVDASFNPFKSTFPSYQPQTQANPTRHSHWQAAYEGIAHHASIPIADSIPDESAQQVAGNTFTTEKGAISEEHPHPSPTPSDVTSEATPPATETSLYASLESGPDTVSHHDDLIQLRGTYILAPLHSGLALIDQHRAHVRILYERYMKQITEAPAASQRLLFPEMLQVSPAEVPVMESLIPSMQKVGFDLSPLGAGSYSILAMPYGAEGLSPLPLVEEILANAVAGKTDIASTVTHGFALTLARKVAVPVGQILSQDEMRDIIERLFTTTTPNLTPDGHTILIMVDYETIERWLG